MRVVFGGLGGVVGNLNALNGTFTATIEESNVVDAVLSNLVVKDELVSSSYGEVGVHGEEVNVPIGKQLGRGCRWSTTEENGGKEERLDEGRHGEGFEDEDGVDLSC